MFLFTEFDSLLMTGRGSVLASAMSRLRPTTTRVTGIRRGYPTYQGIDELDDEVSALSKLQFFGSVSADTNMKEFKKEVQEDVIIIVEKV